MDILLELPGQRKQGSGKLQSGIVPYLSKLRYCALHCSGGTCPSTRD